jgi:hypothetical protein
MCTTPSPKRKAVLAVLAEDVAAPAAVVATPAAVVPVPAAVAKAIPSAPTPGAVGGMPPLVAKKAKASKESAPAMLDESAFR